MVGSVAGVRNISVVRAMQREIIQALNVSAAVDPSIELARRRDFLADYQRHSSAAGLVLGISGGQDSALAGRLCQLAVQQARALGGQATFTAVRMPYGVQSDEADAQLALTFIEPDQVVTFNIKPAVDAIAEEYLRATGTPLSDFGKGNVKARVRMTGQYAIASEAKALVVGTDHAAEAVTGFFTKWGDGGADLLPLAGLTKRQGRALLQELGAPARLYEKEPTADLLDHSPGQADEASLGLRYDDIDTYLEGGNVPDALADLIEARYRATEHKRRPPLSLSDDWWGPSATYAL